jgi:predicted Zn-dependent protease
MQSTAEHRVDLSVALQTTSSDCVLLHPSPQHLLARLSSKILTEHTIGVSFSTSRGKKPVLLSSSLAHEFQRRKCTVDLDVTLEVGNEAEDRDEIEGMSHGQLGFLMKLFERAIENLSGALKDQDVEIGTVVLGGELDGVLIRCGFGVSCYA